MWRLYARTNEAIAIRSTYERLRSCLPRMQEPGTPTVFIAMVQYVDFDAAAIPIGNAFDPYVHKRKSFEHERELRAVVSHMERTAPPNAMSFDIDPAKLIEEVFVAPTAPGWFRELVGKVMARYGPDFSPRQSDLDNAPLY